MRNGNNTEGRDRLEQMIERLVTQKAYLDHAARHIVDLPGAILEVGLGKGRTFDHLRRLFPDRQLYAFDRDVHAPASVVPDKEHLILGDFRQSLDGAASRMGRVAALVHADIGSEDAARDRALADAIAPLISRLLLSDGLVVADRALKSSKLREWKFSPTVGRFPYFMYQAEKAPSQGGQA